jgi:hypothetical protein
VGLTRLVRKDLELLRPDAAMMHLFLAQQQPHLEFVEFLVDDLDVIEL